MRQTLGQLSDCENRYRRHWLDFTRLWQNVKREWRDRRQEQFEQDHLRRLPSSLNRLSAAVGELRDVMQQADRELTETDPSERAL